MNCEANGRPSPKVKWYKNGQLMSYMPDGKTPLANDTQVLKFQDVNPKDNGSYRCFVWNRVGNISTTYTVLAKGSYSKNVRFMLFLSDRPWP